VFQDSDPFSRNFNLKSISIEDGVFAKENDDFSNAISWTAPKFPQILDSFQLTLCNQTDFRFGPDAFKADSSYGVLDLKCAKEVDSSSMTEILNKFASIDLLEVRLRQIKGWKTFPSNVAKISLTDLECKSPDPGVIYLSLTELDCKNPDPGVICSVVNAHQKKIKNFESLKISCKNQTISDFCAEKEKEKIVADSLRIGVPISIILLLFIVITYKILAPRSMDIKCKMYHCEKLSKVVTRSADEACGEFDCFLLFSSDDDDNFMVATSDDNADLKVAKRIIQRLENKYTFKTRSSAALGRMDMNELEQMLSTARRVVVVLSNRFLKSPDSLRCFSMVTQKSK